MKKYTDHNSTPLKFHKFFHYVWTPITLLVSIILLFILFRGFSYNNVGSAVYVTFSVLNFALTAAYFIGFFRWKKYAWYCLFAQLISEAVLYTAALILSVFILPQYISTVIGVLIGFSIRGIPMGIYYYKRRGLFSTEGYNPKAAKAEVSPMHTAGRICPACGKEIAADTRFCTHCGKEITEPDADQSTAVQPASAEVTAAQYTGTAAISVGTASAAEAYTPAEKEAAQPADGHKPKTGRKMVIALIAACICAVALGALNIVQYTQLERYRTQSEALVREIEQLNESNENYSSRVQALMKETADAQLYYKVADFMINDVPTFNSGMYYAEDYIFFTSLDDGMQNFSVTANWNDVIIEFQQDGSSISADFGQSWSGNSISVYYTPEQTGITTLHFYNDQTDDTFRVMIVVVE